jgi:hypothetical protein
MRFMHRKLVVVAIVCLLAALVVPAAFAGGTTHGTTTFTNQTFDDPAGDICPFAITVSYNATVDHTEFYDNSGRVVAVNYHVTQQTTYSANAKTLVGDWFTYEQISKFGYDSSGSRYQISGVGTGQAEKVPLPDGSVFYSAGRIDYLSPTFINNYWINVVNSGISGNVAGFCAALAP